MRPSHSPRRSPGTRDEGSALILVLVLIVVGTLIVLPLLEYAMTVGRANTVLSTKTRRLEAVKGGLRVALADPQELYRYCAGESGGSSTLALGMPTVNDFPLETQCRFLSFSHAADETDLHLGLAATKMGALVPSALTAVVEEDPVTNELTRLVFEMDPAYPLDQWYNLPTGVSPDETRTLTSTPRRIWGPNLPVRHGEARSATPYDMPGPCGDDSCPPSDCTVFFPGTYSDPITVSGNTFFASGIYYFEDVVTIVGDADVVIGMGTHLGCTTDQQAAFYAIDVPSPHNISGLGGTFVLGHDSRLVVTNGGGAPEVRFNQRYVGLTDYNSPASFGVSIVSVNGAVGGDGTIDEDGSYDLADLVVDGVVQVPGSQVAGILTQTQLDQLAITGTDPSTVLVAAQPADDAGYKPSTHTHAPRPPSAPLFGDVDGDIFGDVIEFRSGSGSGAYVTWDPPERPGGLPISYVVEVANSAGTYLGGCEPEDLETGDPVPDAYECVVTGLPGNTSRPFRYTVSAENDLNTSGSIDPARSAPVVGTAWTGIATEQAPAAPAPPIVEPDAVYEGAVRVTWDALGDGHTGTTRVSKYTVTAYLEPLPPDPPPLPSDPPLPPVAIDPPVTCSVEIPLMKPVPQDPDWPDATPDVPTPPDPLYCTIDGLDTSREYWFTVEAENLNGIASALSAFSTSKVAPAVGLATCAMDQPVTAEPPGCAPWAAPLRTVYPFEPDPIVDIILSEPDRADDKVVIDIPGYIAVPQGVFRLFNPHGLGKVAVPSADPPVTPDGNTVEVSGGILAASFRVRDGRDAGGTLTVPIGMLNPIVQRTYLLKTCTPSCSDPRATSEAVVQVNQNGAYAVNSWEVQ